MPVKSHFLLLISAFIAPIAAKQGGEKRLSIRNARAAAGVIYTIPFATPTESLLTRFSSPTRHTARVPTTFSLAIKPVMVAAASCHATTPTMGAKR